MHALKYWVQQSRRPAFRLLLLALVLAIAAISSVGVFSARLQAALQRDATHMLGGDLVIESKVDPARLAWFSSLGQAALQGLRTAQSVVFPSVVVSRKADLLVSLKAVSNEYPLSGQLTIRSAQGEAEKVSHGPPSGEVWVDEGVPGSLGIQIGDQIKLGEVSFRVSRLILVEPDRGAGFASFAPRVMMNKSDLAATGLLGPGSRATWRVYLAGPSKAVQAYQQLIEPKLTASDHLETVEGGRPEISGTLNRANDFLSMAALIGALVACVGMSLVAHQFGREQAREMAILKSLGYTPRHLLKLNLTGLMLLTVLAGALGVLLGWAAHWVLLQLLQSLVGATLPMAGLSYLPFGVVLAGVLLLGFAAAPVAYALRAPTVAVLRQQATGSKWVRGLYTVVMGVAAAAAVSALVVSNVKLAMLLLAAFVTTCGVFAAVFYGLIRWMRAWSARKRSGGGQIEVLQSMSRRMPLLVVQGVSLALGLSALLILAVVQGDLISRWQAVIPPDAPNRFAFNIQPDQAKDFQKQLQTELHGQVRMYPMVRGRLIQINKQLIKADSFSDARAQAMVDREFNLSYQDTLPPKNKVIAGQWFDQNPSEPEVSIEQSVAKRLNLKLGDELTFEVAGVPVKAKVSNIRSLRWDSMEVNFYVIFPSAVLKDFPQTWITAFYSGQAQADQLTRKLVGAFPNVTIINTALIINQIQNILAQVSRAVQFVFLFTVAAGGLVVAACILSGARSRTREAAIYRAMGASTAQLQRAALFELVLLGAVAGFVAALAAEVTGWAVARFVFEFDYNGSGLVLLIGTLVGVVASLVFGGWSVRKVCQAPVMATLREVGN